MMSLVTEILGENARPVRSVYFDKTPDTNWNVAWHQDTSIVVKKKLDISGFLNWSEKDGIPHVEPPVKYLNNILTVRIHVDKANKSSGVLRVVPKTHVNGRVKSGEILNIVEHVKIIECDANPGDILLMRPLLFHSSRKASNPSRRRVIHIEYSAMDLPGNLEWNES